MVMKRCSLFGSCLLLAVFLGNCRSLVSGKSLVLIGGGLSDDNADIWNKIIELAGGVNAARVGIVTAASADPADSAEYYDEMLLHYGAAEAYWIPVHEANKSANIDPAVVNNIRRMTGFIFGGGDQARVISSFYNNPGRVASPALLAIQEVYEGGAVISGSSAGVSCLPWSVMIAGGVSYNGLRYGSFPSGTESSSSDLVYDPAGGISVIEDYVLDTHFSERGREGRLIRLIADTMSSARGVKAGLGVDEDTALVISDVDTAQALGQVVGVSGVWIGDLSTATIDPTSQYFSVKNVRTYYLTQGDVINMRTRAVTFDTTWKRDLKGDEYYQTALTSVNIFGGILPTRSLSEYVRVSTSLFDASQDTVTQGVTVERAPQFAVTFTQTAQSVGYGGYSPVTGLWEISYSDLLVDIGAV